jgi:hypothetical protein
LKALAGVSILTPTPRHFGETAKRTNLGFPNEIKA